MTWFLQQYKLENQDVEKKCGFKISRTDLLGRQQIHEEVMQQQNEFSNSLKEEDLGEQSYSVQRLQENVL